MSGKIETQGREVKSNSGENRNGGNWGRGRAGRTGKEVSYNVLGAKDVANIAGKLRDIGEMALLSGKPRWRGGEQGVC